MRTLATVVATVALALPAAAGTLEGYRCENECPLAQEANSQRAYGLEAGATSAIVKADVAAEIEANLKLV